MKKKSALGRFFGVLALAVITIGVLLYLGKHSLNFFMISFTGEDEIFAWLGLLMTSIGAIGWMLIFLFVANTTIQKGTAITMMVIAALGEFATAGFDMYLNTMQLGNGFQFTPEEIRSMSLVVSGLGLLTGFALIAFTAGDHIAIAFQDDDGDGTINLFDRHDNRRSPSTPTQPVHAFGSETAEGNPTPARDNQPRRD